MKPVAFLAVFKLPPAGFKLDQTRQDPKWLQPPRDVQPRAYLLSPNRSQVQVTRYPHPFLCSWSFYPNPLSLSPLPGKSFLTSKPTSYKGPLRTTAKSPNLYFIRYGDISQSSVKKLFSECSFTFILSFFVPELASSLLFLLILHSKGSTFCDLFESPFFAVFVTYFFIVETITTNVFYLVY